MSKSYSWDRDTITANEIVQGLIQQYGPGQNIDVTMQDKGKQVSYKSSLVPLHCNRCGADFSMTPKYILDAYYTTGYVCSECGPLSESEIKEQHKQKMLKATPDILKKNYNIDVNDLIAKEEEEKAAKAKEDSSSMKALEAAMSEMTPKVNESSSPSSEVKAPSSSSSGIVQSEKVTPAVSNESSNPEEDETEDVSQEEAEEESDEIPDEEIDGSESATEDETETEEDDSDENVSEELADDESVTVGLKTYPTIYELGDEVSDRISEIEDRLGFDPWDSGDDPDDILKSSVTEDTHKLEVTCLVCGSTVQLDSVSDLSEVEEVNEAWCKKNGVLYLGHNALIHACPVCRKSLIENGFNEYHKNAVIRTLKDMHLNIAPKSLSYYVPGSSESYKIEANGVVKTMKLTEIIARWRGKDASKDILFTPPVKETPKTEEPKQQVKSVESIVEDVKKTSEAREAFIKSAKENVADAFQSESKSPIIKTHVVESEEQPEAKQEHPSITITKASSYDSSSTDEINAERVANSSFNSTASETMGALDEEAMEETQERESHNVFNVNSKIVSSKKNVAVVNTAVNPFEHEKDLKESFENSVFASFISDLSDSTDTQCHLILNAKSWEIPIVDFESGLRIICIDLDERSLVNVMYDTLDKGCQFSYLDEIAGNNGFGVLKKKPKAHKRVILYSDEVINRRQATMRALIKHINPSVLPYGEKRIEIKDMYLQYTDYAPFLKDFDNLYSPYPSGKPRTGQIGIIAQWASSKTSTAKDVLNFQAQINEVSGVANLDSLESDYSQYVVASIRYIEQLNKETNRVIYRITDYVEIGSCLLADGLLQCIRALLKEYYIKYPMMRGVSPYIIMELDPNTILSPSVRNYIEHGTLCQMDDNFKMLATGNASFMRGVEQYLRYNYIRLPECRSKPSDGERYDMRLFGYGSIVRRMKDDIMKLGYTNTISDANVRLKFIAQMGYVKVTQDEVHEYYVNQQVVTSLLYDAATFKLQKHDNVEAMFEKGGMVENSNAGFNANNIMANPNLIGKYMNIMQNGTQDAKQLMMMNLMQTNPMMANTIYGMYSNGGQAAQQFQPGMMYQM